MSLSAHIEQVMQNALTYLVSVLNLEVIEAPTHRVVVITGWNYSDKVRQAIARYLVGLIACAIDAALNIRADLEDTPEDRSEIFQNVIAIVGEQTDQLSTDKKQDERNPWIAEGIWHLCLAVANRRPELHPMGSVIALDYAHISAKDHGLDVAAIYEGSLGFGLTLVESKAYAGDPSGAINRAVNFFREVDAGKHSVRIRQAVQIMRTALPEERQNQITPSFWKRIRSYVPNPHYDSNQVVDWANRRPSFGSLQPGRENIVIMPHAISGFDEFFDSIADEMRMFAGSL